MLAAETNLARPACGLFRIFFGLDFMIEDKGKNASYLIRK